MKPSLSEQLEIRTKPTRDLLASAEVPAGCLRHLSELLDQLKSENSTGKIYQGFIEEIEAESRELQEKKQKLVDWMLSKLELLKKSKWVNKPKVANALAQADLILNGKIYEIRSSFYFGSLFDHFEAACDSIAYYSEPTDLFEGWAEIKAQKDVLIYKEQELFPIGKKLEIAATSPEGQRFVEKLGHGFVRASFSQDSFVPGQIRCELDRGKISKIHYPKEWYEALRQSENFYAWTVRKDCEPAVALQFLLLLARHPKLAPVPLGSLPRPESIAEAESLCHHQLEQFFLSGFSTPDWSKAPWARDKIVNLTERLILFFKRALSEIEGAKNPKQKKEKLRGFIREVLRENLAHLSPKERNTKKYIDLLPVVLKEAARSADTAIRQALAEKFITDRLILDETENFAKQYGWRPKRGKGRKKSARF